MAKRKPARPPRRPGRATARRKTGAAARRPRTKAPARTGERRADRRGKGPQTLRVRAFEPTFTVDDVERSERFYTRVVGFMVDERWNEEGKLKGLLLKAGASRLGLSQDDWAKGRDRKKGVGFSLWCETEQDIDALAARITAAGGTLASGPSDEPGLGRNLAVDDPDGFRLRIYRRG
jgi:catechol 2,3-dioxygenase-like lactoylglutathione lyase family enzyme